jgi:hypothetical protein
VGKTTPRYYTVAKLAALLQLNRTTVTRMAHTDPKMPVLRISGIGGRRGVLHFPIAETNPWLRAKTSGVRRSPLNLS